MNEQTVDPVCGMTVDPATAAGVSTYETTTIYFCSSYCKARFDNDPDAFASSCNAGSRRSCCH